MRFAMLARNPELYSHRRIVEAAEAAGHQIHVINTLHVHMNITSNRATLRYGGSDLPLYDAVIPRIGASITHYGLAVLRQFEMQGVYPLNESIAIGRSRDKLRALQILARAGVNMPVTAFAHGPRKAEDVIREVGGAPVVIKLLEGTQGMGVVLAETEASAKSVIEAFSAANVNIMVQEFIRESGATDVRAFVVGGRVVAAGHGHIQLAFYDNTDIDGLRAQLAAAPTRLLWIETPANPTWEVTDIRAAAALDLNVCGVDMLRTKRGPMVMEVNSAPGLEGVESSTGVDVAHEIVSFLELHARHGDTITRGKG